MRQTNSLAKQRTSNTRHGPRAPTLLLYRPTFSLTCRYEQTVPLCHIHGPSKDGRQTGMDTRRARMVRSATTSVTCFLGQLPHDKCDGDFVSLFPATALIARTHLMLARSPSTSCHDGHGSIAVVVSLDVGLSIVPFPVALALPLQRGSICKIFFFWKWPKYKYFFI
jgi:hypothetical protein